MKILAAATLSTLLALPLLAQDAKVQVMMQCTTDGVEFADVPSQGLTQITVQTPQGSTIDEEKLKSILATHPKKLQVYTCTIPTITESDLTPAQLNAYAKTLAPFLDEMNNAHGPEQAKARQEFEQAAKFYLSSVAEHAPMIVPSGDDYFSHILMDYYLQRESPGAVLETFLVNPKAQVVLGYGLKPWMHLAISEIAKVPRDPEELAPARMEKILDKDLELQQKLGEYELRMKKFLKQDQPVSAVLQFMRENENLTLYEP